MPRQIILLLDVEFHQSKKCFPFVKGAMYRTQRSLFVAQAPLKGLIKPQVIEGPKFRSWLPRQSLVFIQ